MQKKNTIKDKVNKEDNQQLFTKQTESTNVETIDTKSDDEDTELVEEQAAVHHTQELTGDPLPSVVQLENLENQIYQCVPAENNIPKYMLLDMTLKFYPFKTFCHMVVVATIVHTGK